MYRTTRDTKSCPRGNVAMMKNCIKEKWTTKKLSTREDCCDKQLSQGENDISYNLWDSPLGPVNEQDPDTAAQEVLGCLSTSGPEAAVEAVTDMPGAALCTARAMGSDPVRAAEAQEEAMAAFLLPLVIR